MALGQHVLNAPMRGALTRRGLLKAALASVPLLTLGLPHAFAAGTGGRMLVVFFSRAGENNSVGVIETGNTAVIAGMIAEKTGADVFELKPARPYPENYRECVDQAERELLENARPKYLGEAANPAQYDRVFIGAPVWASDWPMIIYTFLENHDLAGKTLHPFVTHELSGVDGVARKLAAAVPGAKVTAGLAVRGRTAQFDRKTAERAVDEWLARLGL